LADTLIVYFGMQQFPGFWKLRKSLEKKVEKKAKEAQSEIVVEPNVKPSKIKQNPGFFSKLTKHYSSKILFCSRNSL
jgi:hypothetical protein